MPTVESGVVPQAMRQAVSEPDETGPSDAELLGSFIALRDERAFEALLRRYSGMVMGVCRRILRDESDAEDAFQATFLVLVRKASSIKPRSLAGSWLYGVATKTAFKARTMRTKRAAKEREVAIKTDRTAVANDAADLEEVLDQELRQLPSRYRATILLCDLEGKTITEASRQLGRPPGTVGTHLRRGRQMLARRLTKHGFVLSGAAMAAMLAQNTASASAVPAFLVTSTAKAAMVYSAGGAAASALSAKAVVLAQSVIKSMLLSKLGVATSVIVAIAVVGATVAPSYTGNAQPALPDHQVGIRSAALSADDSRVVTGVHEGLARVDGAEVVEPIKKPLLALLADDELESPEAQAEKTALVAATVHVRQLKLQRVDDGHPIDLIEKPLLAFGDSARIQHRGTLWAWGTQGRPVAFLELFQQPQQEGMWVHSVTLSAEPTVTMETPIHVRWTPQTMAFEPSQLAGSPPPAVKKTARLRQLKEAARRFGAHEFWDPGRSRYELRLLVQPVHRYVDQESKVLDGAVFVFAHGTNPECLLLIEAIGESFAEAHWQYALIRSSDAESHVELDGDEVWRRDRADLAAPDPESPYWTFFSPQESD